MVPDHADPPHVGGLVVEAARLVAFRAYASADVALDAPRVAIVGPNGAGKTTVLEAVHLALAGRSFRTSAHDRCIRRDEPFGRVEVRAVEDGRPRRLVAILERARPRRHEEDGVPAGAAELAARHPVLAFAPDRLAVVRDAPAMRRAYLDAAIARLWPAYGRLAAEHGRLLAQRTALLRRVRAGRVHADALAPWDEQLARLGADVHGARQRLAERLEAPFAGSLGRIRGSEAETRLVYRPGGPGEAAALLAALEERRATDVERGTTGVGPHLDDIVLLERGRDLRAYGSQGEQRSAYVALVLAEARLVREVRGLAPLLLLDDVLSELDPRRRAAVVEEAASLGQVLLTATDDAVVPASVDRRVHVLDGAVA